MRYWVKQHDRNGQKSKSGPRPFSLGVVAVIAIAIAGLTLSLVLIGEKGRPNETKIERMQRKFGKDCEIKRTLASRYPDESWAQSPHFLKRYCTPFGM